jgi:hypothetical protein
MWRLRLAKDRKPRRQTWHRKGRDSAGMALRFSGFLPGLLLFLQIIDGLILASAIGNQAKVWRPGAVPVGQGFETESLDLHLF